MIVTCRVCKYVCTAVQLCGGQASFTTVDVGLTAVDRGREAGDALGRAWAARIVTVCRWDPHPLSCRGAVAHQRLALLGVVRYNCLTLTWPYVTLHGLTFTLLFLRPYYCRAAQSVTECLSWDGRLRTLTSPASELSGYCNTVCYCRPRRGSS